MRRPGALLLLAFLAAAAPAGEVEVGATIGELTFTDTWFLPRRLEPGPLTVLAFVTPRCPIARRYLPELVRLEAAYRAQGVRFVIVDASPDPDVLATAAFGHGLDLPLPLVKDETGRAARALGVTRTPEVAVLDAQQVLRYRGRIDDQVRLGGARLEPGRRDLVAALDELLAGAPVSVPTTPVDGCLIAAPEATPAPPAPAPTFTRDVAPLLARHCQECHRPDGSAPFPLVSLADARSEGATLAEAVAQGRMPPWFAGAGSHELVNARRLSPEERRTLVDWVRGGMPEGEPAPAPELPPAPAWQIGTPDLVLELPQPIQVPASGTMPYQYALLPHRFTHDTWVQKLEISAGDAPQVVHHVNVFFLRPGKAFDPSQLIAGKVPGSAPMALEDGVAVLIPKGALLGLQIHYQPSGEAVASRVRLGLGFPRATVRKQLRTAMIQDRALEIPPGAPHHRVEASTTFAEDVVAGGLFAHMHLRGKDVSFRAVYPDGRSEPLLDVPSYSFNWQTAYVWKSPRRFPRGTRIECVAHFDNSAWNPYNPDPTRAVRWGLQTTHEMLECSVFYALADEDLALEVDPATGAPR